MSTLRTTLLLIAASLALVLGADAALAQTPTPTPSPTPAPPLWQSIDLGVVGGNAYSPQSVTVDPARGLAYVFSGRVPEVDGRAANAVTVVRLRDGRIVRRGIVDLGGENSTSGRIWISRDGRRGLLLDNTANQLYHYNPRQRRHRSRPHRREILHRQPQRTQRDRPPHRFAGRLQPRSAHPALARLRPRSTWRQATTPSSSRAAMIRAKG
ncbi:MAG: hypothetical protein R2856_12160 [Caldilineaceae bacterium]